MFVATRHHQFKVNMSRDNDFLGVSQDNPDLITYIREVHIKPAVELHHSPFETINPVLTNDVEEILTLLKSKVSNPIFQSYCTKHFVLSAMEHISKRALIATEKFQKQNIWNGIYLGTVC